MAVKAEDYFRGLLNRAGSTVPQDHKAVFEKKLNDVKAKYAASPIASPQEVAQRIKEANATPAPESTEQKVNHFKEKYKHMLPSKPAETQQAPAKKP